MWDRNQRITDDGQTEPHFEKMTSTFLVRCAQRQWPPPLRHIAVAVYLSADLFICNRDNVVVSASPVAFGLAKAKSVSTNNSTGVADAAKAPVVRCTHGARR